MLKLVYLWYVSQADLDNDHIDGEDDDHDWNIMRDILRRDQEEDRADEKQLLLREVAELAAVCTGVAAAAVEG